jgi:hypothetical protein
MDMTSIRARLAALVLPGLVVVACNGGGGQGDGETAGTDTDATGETGGLSMSAGPQPTTTGVTVTGTVTTVGPSDTGSVDGPCCAARNEPGCAEDPAIAACVCEVDRFCCESVWDDVCAEKVAALGCGVCDPGPSTTTMTTTATTNDVTTSDVTTGTPPDNVGPCCSPHPETGCEHESLSECVCANEPSCCDEGWHEGCVAGVDAFGCGVCPADPTDATTETDTGTPPDNTESCCTVHESTGCEYEAIADCVCAEHPACCDIGWDDSCIDAVGALGCGVCPP